MKKILVLFLVALIVLSGCGKQTTAPAAQTADGQNMEIKEFSVGYSSRIVNPDEALPLAGYGNVETRYMREINGDIKVFVIAISDGEGNDILWINTDLIQTSAAQGESMQNMIYAATGVPIERIYISANHSHSAPSFSSGSNERVARYQEKFYNELTEVAVEAMADRKPATMETGSVETENLNFVKHYSYVDENGVTAQKRIELLAGLTRLRQLCCEPSLCLDGYAGGSGKLEQCVELVKNAVQADHEILLFSQFTSMLDILQSRLEGEGMTCFVLKGDTPKEERMSLVERFNAGEADVFLISLKAGGTGLNLTGADMVIHYDPWWNTAAQNQATDRAYRIGQTQSVQVFKLIAADTIEERILLLQQEKAALSDAVLTGDEGLGTLDEKTMRELLK